ncbi:MAG: hypothetical protein PWP31_126 [Clostridia bacterium]|nr:hypothetical protein [Clostridia bacterium]
MIISFISGLAIVLILAVSIVRPWRGLFILGFIVAIAWVITERTSGIEVFHMVVTLAIGAVFLALVERIDKYWNTIYQQSVSNGKQLLLGSLAFIILFGVLIAPLWGLIIGAGIGGLGSCLLNDRNLWSAIPRLLIIFILKEIALLLPGIILGSRLFGFF